MGDQYHRRTSERLTSRPQQSFINLDADSDDDDPINLNDHDKNGQDWVMSRNSREAKGRTGGCDKREGGTKKVSTKGRKRDEKIINTTTTTPTQEPLIRPRQTHSLDFKLGQSDYLGIHHDAINLLDSQSDLEYPPLSSKKKKSSSNNQLLRSKQPQAPKLTKKQRIAQFDYSDDSQFFFGVLGKSVVAPTTISPHPNPFSKPTTSIALTTSTTTSTVQPRPLPKRNTLKQQHKQSFSLGSSRNHVSGNMFDEFNEDEEIAALSTLIATPYPLSPHSHGKPGEIPGNRDYNNNNNNNNDDDDDDDGDLVSGDDTDNYLYIYDDNGDLMMRKKTKGQVRLERAKKKWSSFSGKMPKDVMDDDINHPNGFIITVKLTHCEIKTELVREQAVEEIYPISPSFDPYLLLSPLNPTMIISSPIVARDTNDDNNSPPSTHGNPKRDDGANEVLKRLPRVNGLDLFPDHHTPIPPFSPNHHHPNIHLGDTDLKTNPHHTSPINADTNTIVSTSTPSSHLSPTPCFSCEQSQFGQSQLEPSDRDHYSDLNPFLCTSQELLKLQRFDLNPPSSSSTSSIIPTRSQPSLSFSHSQNLIDVVDHVTTNQSNELHHTERDSTLRKITTSTTTPITTTMVNTTTPHPSLLTNTNIEDSDSDLEIIGVANNPFNDPMIFTPHTRFYCKRLLPLPPILIESLKLDPVEFSRTYPLWAYCDNCYCCICDAPVERCGNWTLHFKQQDEINLKKEFKSMLNYCHKNNLLPSLRSTSQPTLPLLLSPNSPATGPDSTRAGGGGRGVSNPETYLRTKQDNTFILSKMKDKPPGFLAKDGKSKSIYAMFAQHHG